MAYFWDSDIFASAYCTVWGSENYNFCNIGKSCQIRFNILPSVYGSIKIVIFASPYCIFCVHACACLGLMSFLRLKHDITRPHSVENGFLLSQ